MGRRADIWSLLWASWQPDEWRRVQTQLAAEPPAALILFRRHTQTLAAVRTTVRAVRRTAAAPVWLAVDEEGGPVRRLPPPFPAFPAASMIAAQAVAVDTAAGWVRAHAENLVALGLDVNFAPVADLAFDAEHPALRARMFARAADTCAAYVRAYTEGLQAGGIAGCAKHFPGHGAVAADSHATLDTLRRSEAEVLAEEAIPFRAGARAGVPLMMAGHFVWPAVDAVRPVSCSPAAVTWARRRLKFAGLLLTDDLEMGAVAAMGELEDVAAEAVAAGYQGILLCGGFERAAQVAAALAQRAARSAALAAAIEAAARAGRRLRANGVPRTPQAEPVWRRPWPGSLSPRADHG